MDPNRRYRLAGRAAIRPERFGGLIYRHDNHRLYFIHSRGLVDFLSGLDGTRPLAEAVDHFVAAHGLPPAARENLLQSFRQLEKLGVLDEL